MKNKGKRVNILQGRTKEWGEVKPRQYRSNQGRSPKKEAETMKVIAASLAMTVLFSIVYGVIQLIG
jgi:hypothetical protein